MRRPGEISLPPGSGSARAAGAPAGPGRTTPCAHPADLRPALPGVPEQWPAVLQPRRRRAVSGARQRAAGGGVGPAVAGQGDDEGWHCPGTGAAMTVMADGLCRGERLGWRHAARLTVMDLLARASRTAPSVATGRSPTRSKALVIRSPDAVARLTAPGERRSRAGSGGRRDAVPP